MRTIGEKISALLVIDFQERLMPAIHEGEAAMANAKRLIDAARLLEVPVFVTEQNPKGLGATVPGLSRPDHTVIGKMTFDACASGSLLPHLKAYAQIVVAGCEAHVCVLQTVLGLLDGDRQVFVVRDAVGSRRAESKETAIQRMENHGSEIVTTEMVIFEWLASAAHPRFREAIALVK